MPNTYELITTQTLASSAGSIAVSIPTGFTDIQLRLSLRADRASNAEGPFMYLNTDTNTANYTRLTFYDEDGGVGAEVARGTASSRQFGGIPAASMASNLFGTGVVDLPNYSSSAQKSFNTSLSFQRTGGPTRYIWNNIMSWTGTSAISTVTFGTNNGSNYVAGSSVSVYGIKKA